MQVIAAMEPNGDACLLSWAEILKLVIPLLGNAVVAIIVVLLGFAIWKAQQKLSPTYNSQSYVRQKTLDACMRAWGLLAFITEAENPLTIIGWETASDGNIYFFRKSNIEKFIIQLAEVFYSGGHGLLLSPKVKKLLFEYRGIVYGLRLSAQGQDGDVVPLQNPEPRIRMLAIYDELNQLLKDELAQLQEEK